MIYVDEAGSLFEAQVVAEGEEWQAHFVLLRTDTWQLESLEDDIVDESGESASCHNIDNYPYTFEKWISDNNSVVHCFGSYLESVKDCGFLMKTVFFIVT